MSQPNDGLAAAAAKLTKLQTELVVTAENGLVILHARKQSYRKLKRLGLIEEPVRQLSAVLTERGQRLYNRLNGIEENTDMIWLEDLPEFAEQNDDGVWCMFCGNLLIASFHLDGDSVCSEECDECGAPDPEAVALYFA